MNFADHELAHFTGLCHTKRPIDCCHAEVETEVLREVHRHEFRPRPCPFRTVKWIRQFQVLALNQWEADENHNLFLKKKKV